MASPRDLTEESKFYDESYPIPLIARSLNYYAGGKIDLFSYFVDFFTMLATTVDKLALGFSVLEGTTAAGG